MPLAYYSFIRRPVVEAEKVADDIEATGGTVLRNGRYIVSVTMGGDPVTNETVRLLQGRTDLQVLRTPNKTPYGRSTSRSLPHRES